jgi:hypothetical protein
VLKRALVADAAISLWPLLLLPALDAVDSGRVTMDSLALAAMLSAMLLLVFFGMGTAQFYRFRGTRVAVIDRQVRVTRRDRVLCAIPIEAVVQTKVYGETGWHELLLPFNTSGGPLPRLVIWSTQPSGRVELPVLLWKEDARRLEQQMNGYLSLR